MKLKHRGIIDIFTKLGKERLGVWLSGIKGEGECKKWYSNGQILQHGFWKNGKLEGEFKIWYNNGQMWAHSFYEDGKLEGEFKKWNENGKIETHALYKDGRNIKDLK